MKNMKALASRWNPWPVSIIAFFTVAIVGCGTFVAFCSRHPADLVASDYYEQELRYQGQLDRLQHTQQGAQSAAVEYDASRKVITVSLPSVQQKADLQGTIQLYRPSAMNLDREIKLEVDAKGIQVIDASKLLPGLWKVRVSWTTDRKDYFTDQKVVIGSKVS
jgi:hypothetical protein